MRVEDVLCLQGERHSPDLTKLLRATASSEVFPLLASDEAALAELVLNLSAASADYEPSHSILIALRAIEAKLQVRYAPDAPVTEAP